MCHSLSHWPGIVCLMSSSCRPLVWYRRCCCRCCSTATLGVVVDAFTQRPHRDLHGGRGAYGEYVVLPVRAVQPNRAWCRRPHHDAYRAGAVTAVVAVKYCPPNVSLLRFARNISCVTLSVQTFLLLGQGYAIVVHLGHRSLSKALPGLNIYRSIYLRVRESYVRLAQISDGSCLSCFCSGSHVCPQTIGKTTKKDLRGDVTTTFPSLVLSSSDFTTENVRRAGATPDRVRPFTLEILGLGWTLSMRW